MEKRELHPNSIANLTPVKRGDASIGGGRKNGSVGFGTIMRKLLYAPRNQLPEKYQRILDAYNVENLAEALEAKKIELAFSASSKKETQLRSIESIEYRCDGAPKQHTELTGKDGRSLFSREVQEYENAIKVMSVVELAEHKLLLEQADSILKIARERELIEENASQKAIDESIEQ